MFSCQAVLADGRPSDKGELFAGDFAFQPTEISAPEQGKPPHPMLISVKTETAFKKLLGAASGK